MILKSNTGNFLYSAEPAAVFENWFITTDIFQLADDRVESKIVLKRNTTTGLIRAVKIHNPAMPMPITGIVLMFNSVQIDFRTDKS